MSFTMAGGPVYWLSILQTIVLLFTIEAEYMIVSEIFKKSIWIYCLVNDLGISQEHIKMFCDRQRDVCLSNNQVNHAWTKHIHVWFHFVREIVNEGTIVYLKLELLSDPMNMLRHMVAHEKLQHYIDLIKIRGNK